MWQILVGALLGGVANSISASAQADQQRSNIERAKMAYRGMLTDEHELNRMLLNNKRIYGSRLTNLMNTTAIGTSRHANSGTIKAAAAAPTIAESLRADQQTEQSVLAQNKAIYGQMAQLELGMPANDSFGNFFAGSLEGAGIGIEAMNAMKPRPTSPMTELKEPSRDYSVNDFIKTNPQYNPTDPSWYSGFKKRNLDTWQMDFWKN